MIGTTTARSHLFHIPVLGTGFTIDTPLKVARYGISSVVSLVDDVLVERMRRHHSVRSGRAYQPIDDSVPDFRAERFRAYLNLLNELVYEQIAALKSQTFGNDSDLDACFEMLPDGELRSEWQRVTTLPPGAERNSAEAALRKALEPGSIDVNIMTKLDRRRWIGGAPVDAQYSDAVAALRGFAGSTLRSAVVLSAGLNPALFAALASYPDFIVDEHGMSNKRVVLKVSDYRSALIQGTMLAKKGVWVSEFRVESGLNCGGHAFASKGMLLGPILEEFQSGRAELFDKLHASLAESRRVAGLPPVDPESLRVAVTVQGGVGTAQESAFLREQYRLDRVGWGTPFLLVPEAVNLDQMHIQRLCEAGPDDVLLSEASPLGIPFWTLRNSASEQARRRRIEEGKPGVACKRKFLAFNTEFGGEPICTASRPYQTKKLTELAASTLPARAVARLKESVLAKACLCMDLAASVASEIAGTTPPEDRTDIKTATTAVTPGPNIVNFSRVASLREMVGHIYGRLNLIAREHRPHVFLRELEIYLEVLKRELYDTSIGVTQLGEKYFSEVRRNIVSGIEYYRDAAERIVHREADAFRAVLDHAYAELARLLPEPGAQA